MVGKFLSASFYGKKLCEDVGRAAVLIEHFENGICLRCNEIEAFAQYFFAVVAEPSYRVFFGFRGCFHRGNIFG